MSSEIKVSSVKAKDGTAGISIADSTGRVSFSENNPTITLGSNTTFPDGMIVDRQYYKYALSSNSTYSMNTNTYTIITRTSSSDSSVQNISIETEHTYIYEFQLFQELYRINNPVGNRFFDCRLYEGTTDRNQGGTSVDTLLAYGIQGRELSAGSTASAPTYGLFSYKGAIYYGPSATTTRYVYLAATSNDSDKTLVSYFTSGFPMYLFITKIKGNKATDVT